MSGIHVPEEPFNARVQSGLADEYLHQALETVTGALNVMRKDGLGSLTDLNAVRDQARAIRANTLRKLDVYLAQFVEQVEAAGGHVHWARDAQEANQHIVNLAQERGVELVVKSKSMLTEEIDLNHAFEAVGIPAVESDLGERIIQLAGEKPSHIIAPAVHKTAAQVGQLFHEKLDMPLSDDVSLMVATARTALRDTFMKAGMGISGVNFGVAESGTICLVTNEGNGRMVTSVPPVHVALMGIERLVPTIQDLTVMLQLLARYATGQKTTVYTSLLTGPRRHLEPDGPQELHIVLVDNGRTRMLAGQLAEMLYCIRCGSCLNACPVYREIGGHAYGSMYSGPMGAIITPALGGLGDWADLPQASSLCGACKEVCPVRIDIPRMLLKLRADSVQEGHDPRWARTGIKLYTWAAQRPAIFRLGGKVSALLTGLIGRDGWVRRLPGPLAGWTVNRDFPALPGQSFVAEWERKKQ